MPKLLIVINNGFAFFGKIVQNDSFTNSLVKDSLKSSSANKSCVFISGMNLIFLRFIEVLTTRGSCKLC